MTAPLMTTTVSAPGVLGGFNNLQSQIIKIQKKNLQGKKERKKDITSQLHVHSMQEEVSMCNDDTNL